MGFFDFLKRKSKTRKEEVAKMEASHGSRKSKSKLTEAQEWSNYMHKRRKETVVAHRKSGSYVVMFPDGTYFQCCKQLAMTYTVNPFKFYK